MTGTRPEVLIAGHSHAVAMGLPGAPRNSAPRLVAVGPHRLALTGGWPRGDDYWAALEGEARGRALVLSWRGSEYLGEFLIAPTPLFDFVARARPGAPIDPSAQWVPESLVRAKFSKWVVDSKPVLARMKPVAARVFLPGSPPPKDDDNLLRRCLMSETAFKMRVEKMGVSLDDVTFSPPPLRLKLWELTQDLLEETAQAAGVQFVPCPIEARDERGFLRREYWNDDITHGNTAFGALMLEKMEHLL